MRPELERKTRCLIDMDPLTQVTTLHAPLDVDASHTSAARRPPELRQFAFDRSFWSHDASDGHHAHQEDVYASLGEDFLDHNFEGYHTCIFAYGQTGSGKSYTMMGTPDQPGLIPRTCEDLLSASPPPTKSGPTWPMPCASPTSRSTTSTCATCWCRPAGRPHYLKIHESPTEGPYVKDLTELPVRSLDEIMRLMRMGDASHTTASTKMNDTSSRSHAVFTIMLRQMHHDADTDETTERSSRIRLVDLAGSERAKATEATGARLREESNINKSLTTLGCVIAALADPKRCPTDARKKKPVTAAARSHDAVVPYRDSILTWLLKDSLGGNSKTAIIACIAPADYDETLSTLRYADQAKRIRTHAVVNQDHMSTAERDAQIAAMAEEIRLLQLSVSDSRQREKNAQEAEERLEEYQGCGVARMQRMMEERSMLAESRIKKLQTENEALKLNLRLAIDSLKIPIPPASCPPTQQADADDDQDDDLQEEMRHYLLDMGNLRRLIGGNLARFRDKESVRMPLGARDNV